MDETISVGDYFWTETGQITKLRHISPKGTKCSLIPPDHIFGISRSMDQVRKMKKLTPEEITMYLLRK